MPCCSPWMKKCMISHHTALPPTSSTTRQRGTPKSSLITLKQLAIYCYIVKYVYWNSVFQTPLNKSCGEIRENECPKKIVDEMKQKEHKTSCMNGRHLSMMIVQNFSHLSMMIVQNPKLKKSATWPSALKELVSLAESKSENSHGDQYCDG